MACRCSERRAQLKAAGSSLLKGDVRGAGAQVSAAGRTLADDARSGALAKEARRLAASKLTLRRR